MRCTDSLEDCGSNMDPIDRGGGEWGSTQDVEGLLGLCASAGEGRSLVQNSSPDTSGCILFVKPIHMFLSCGCVMVKLWSRLFVLIFVHDNDSLIRLKIDSFFISLCITHYLCSDNNVC